MTSHIKLNKTEWNKLLDKIEKEEVIIVLGDELSMLNINGNKILLKDYLLDHLVETLNDQERNSSEPTINRDSIITLSDISYENKKKYWDNLGADPYSETSEILSDIPLDLFEFDSLQKLLSIDKFKIILTTSFDNIAYTILKKIYGEKTVSELTYERGTNKQDISQETDKKIIYHLFGKACYERKGFVLTEDDLLEYIHYWMDQNYRPKLLSNILSDKYILVIGCSYPDWLFRFFFHSLKFTSIQNSEKKDNGLLADHDLDPELISFLRRMQTNIHDDAINFINELCERWEKRKTNNPANTDFEKIEDSFGEEAFLSYASEDYDIAVEIAKTFENLGLKVWFDKINLESGDKYEKKIRDKINKSKTFIPILSPNTENKDGGRFFRKEWKWAKDAEEAHFGTEDNFIRPILIGGFVMNEQHVFNDCHCTDLSDPNERRNRIRRMIRNIRK